MITTLTGAQRATLLITLAVTIGILIWDYVLLRDGMPGNTISAAVKAVSGCIPIPLVFGIWTAHMFWYQRGAPTGIGLIQGILFALIFLGSWGWWEASDDVVRLWMSNHPEIVVVMGYLAGHWVWPQYTGVPGA